MTLVSDLYVTLCYFSRFIYRQQLWSCPRSRPSNPGPHLRRGQQVRIRPVSMATANRTGSAAERNPPGLRPRLGNGSQGRRRRRLGRRRRFGAAGHEETVSTLRKDRRARRTWTIDGDLWTDEHQGDPCSSAAVERRRGRPKQEQRRTFSTRRLRSVLLYSTMQYTALYCINYFVELVKKLVGFWFP